MLVEPCSGHLCGVVHIVVGVSGLFVDLLHVEREYMKCPTRYDAPSNAV
jgi:hypothetical protein